MRNFIVTEEGEFLTEALDTTSEIVSRIGKIRERLEDLEFRAWFYEEYPKTKHEFREIMWELREMTKHMEGK